jgi:hypothetical protein
MKVAETSILAAGEIDSERVTLYLLREIVKTENEGNGSHLNHRPAHRPGERERTAEVANV